MPGISIKNVDKVYDNGFQAVHQANLEIADGEFMVLVGPSGCGKTTTLRMVAGLEDITAGEVAIGDRVINEVEPKDRDIAMVFQNYALYPHMTIYENMAYGLKLRKTPKAEINERVNKAAKLLGLDTQLAKRPKQLSGGQRQRVALGRAIVREPAAFLFDEPLSNLDAKLRGDMRYELKTLQQDLGTTSVYVTHDQIEAMTLGDRITVMNAGVIQQVADPTTLYDHPFNRFVASFIGTPPMNMLIGSLSGSDGNFVVGTDGGLQVALKSSRAAGLDDLVGKGQVSLGLRPEFLHDTRYGEVDSSWPTLEATVKVVEVLGDHQYVYLQLADSDAVWIMKNSSHCPAKPGQAVTIALDVEQTHLFAGVAEDSPNRMLPEGFQRYQPA